MSAHRIEGTVALVGGANHGIGRALRELRLTRMEEIHAEARDPESLSRLYDERLVPLRLRDAVLEILGRALASRLHAIVIVAQQASSAPRGASLKAASRAVVVWVASGFIVGCSLNAGGTDGGGPAWAMAAARTRAMPDRR